jgi:single-strand DNA-binding protein
MKVTTRGLVATDPRFMDNGELMFRFAELSENTDTPPNWFTVMATGRLAERVEELIAKNDKIIVVGALRVRDWDNGERSGTFMEIYAETMGHDLTAKREEI